MAEITPEGIIYPVNGDSMTPLAPWFAQLASSADEAIYNLRLELDKPALPDPQSVEGASMQDVTATAWADLPNANAITLELIDACWVQISHSAWLQSTVGDLRVSSRVTGATTLAENQLQVGGPNTAWGQVLYQAANPGTNQGSGSRIVRLNPGTNTIRLRAYRSGTSGGTRRANYSTLQVTPLRWA